MCETPKTSRPSSIVGSTSEDFKIVPVTSSNTPKVLGNLTGNHRIVRDCVADIYNAVQQWNRHFLRGVDILGEIKTIKFDAIDCNEIYHDSLQEYCESLGQVLKSMSSILGMVKTYVNTMMGMGKLLSNSNEILFSTWKFGSFVSVFQQILSVYEKEFQLKTYIKEHIAHTKDKSSVAFYFIAWVNEAYINEEVGVQLEAMLVETGHR